MDERHALLRLDSAAKSGCFTSSGYATAQDTVAICHFREGSNDWEQQLLSQKKADSHLTHHANDGSPGGVVPGPCFTGFVFDADCQPVAAQNCTEYDGYVEACGADFALAVEQCNAPDLSSGCGGGCVTAHRQCESGCQFRPDALECAMTCNTQLQACFAGCTEECVGSATAARDLCDEGCVAAFPTCADTITPR
jgi:hypothetical protein